LTSDPGISAFRLAYLNFLNHHPALRIEEGSILLNWVEMEDRRGKMEATAQNPLRKKREDRREKRDGSK